MNALDGRFATRQIFGTREYQEDDFGLIEPSNDSSDSSVVLLLADGMGGHVGGDTASATIIRTFAEQFHATTGSVTDRLHSCLRAANEAIADAIEKNPDLDGMGSTIVAAVVTPQGLDWISVGDSPLWLFRNGELHRLNADHSMAPALAKLVDEGRMTAQDAATDPNRHALRSAVVGDEIPLVDVSTHPVPVNEDDCVLIGSDGLFTLDEEKLTGVLSKLKETSTAEVVDTIVQAVEDAGHSHQDNTTVLLYTLKDLKPVSTEPSTRRRRIGLIAMGVLLVSLGVAGAFLMSRANMEWQIVRDYLRIGVSVSDSTDTAAENEIRESKPAVQEEQSRTTMPEDTLGESQIE